jgi:gliding motility-associated-like protein
LVFIPAKATHIVGGGFDVQHISGSTYRLTLVVYRDCLNGQAPFNQTLYVGIYSKQSHELIDSIGMTLDQSVVTKLNPSLPKCAVPVPGCTEKAIYVRTINLPAFRYNDTSGYYLSWERCCRNHIIQNIQQPGEASMAFYAEIPSPARYINSTPRLVNNPFTVLCIDNVFNYPIKFSDADGDSITYELINPVNGTLTKDNPNSDQFGSIPILNSGPYQDVVWNFGYNKNVSIKGNPPLSLGLNDGMMKVRPNETGVFAVAIKVREFRNGIEIGSVNLELQFTVIICVTNTFPKVQLFQNGLQVNTDTLRVTIPNSINFGISVTDEDNLDTVFVTSVVNDEKPEHLEASVSRVPQQVNYNWTWKTYCDLHTRPINKFLVTATDEGCPIPKTIEFPFVIKVDPMPLHPPTDVLCIELKQNKECIVYFGDSARNFPYYKQYKFYRGINNEPFVLLDSIANRNASFYLDKNTPDYNQVNYRYKINVENVCGYEGFSSDTLGTFDQLKMIPDRQYMYNVTVENNQVRIIWNQTKELDFARYFLWKGYRNQKPDEFIMEVDFTKQKDTTYLDAKVMVSDTSHCYYLVMLDTCGNYGPAGEIFCTTVLRGNSNPFEHHLNWQKFIQSDEYTVAYDLIKFAPNNTQAIPVGLFNERTFSTIDDKLNVDDGRYIYSLDVIHHPYGWPTDVRVRSTSNELPLFQIPKVYAPNAFTPNNDNLNEEWNLHDVFVRNFQLKVYDRWGQLVFETTDKNKKWDATDLSGNKVASGVYVYTIAYDGWDDQYRFMRGNVTVLK